MTLERDILFSGINIKIISRIEIGDFGFFQPNDMQVLLFCLFNDRAYLFPSLPRNFRLFRSSEKHDLCSMIRRMVNLCFPGNCLPAPRI